MKSLPAVLAITLLISCSTSTPLDRGMASSRVRESERYFWIEGFGRPLNLLRVEDARQLHAAWSLALQPDAALPKHLPRYLEPNDEVKPKDLRRALEFMLPKLERALDRSQGGEFRDEDIGELLQVAEVHRALELKLEDPVPRKLSLEFGPPKMLIESGSHRLLSGKHPAIDAAGADDPADSSFWTRPKDISQLDLGIGFGRKATLAAEVHNGEPCAFHEAKTGYGIHAGFTLECGDKQIKVKFLELRSEPFATRIFWALGYNVDPVDYVSELDFTYSPEFFTRINKRKNLTVDLTALGVITVHRIQLTHKVDPFTLLKGAKLTDGRWIDAAELKARLIENPKADLLALEGSDLNRDFAERIKTLTTVEAQLQAKSDADRIGPWQWQDFDHPLLRETRGLLAAAAWLGWYDCRFDNNRLVLVKSASGKTEPKHFITDLGSVLGYTTRWFTFAYEKPEQMKDTVTAKSFFSGVRIVNYRTLERNRAFEQATIDDLRWGASWLNRISDRQIHDAAIGSGFDEARAKVIVAKLHNRLSHMNEVLY
jgi:hypothetical protein